MIVYATVTLLLTGLPVDVHAGESELTTLKLDERPGHAQLSWSDAEDVVRGTLTPFPIRAGESFQVALVVGTVQGQGFEGPVTIALRPLEEMGGGESATVTRSAGEKAWLKTFTPQESGPHRLEVSFRTTHLKVIRGIIPVAGPRLPRWLLYAVGGSLLTVSLAIGVWITFRRKDGEQAS
ncbi:MAG: hypothetical protein AMXMBFR34_50280 [Myxococcaceae bacterium]